ncbi:MAG: response regulator [Deltaproteobacteria bacterium]|nr:response regulator [Deltaproteobacteria bacterium]
MIRGPYSILIIDDDYGIRSLLEEFLEDKGYRVETAGDGHAAVDLIKTVGFDVIVADLKMPDTNGMDIVRFSRQVSPDAMVIIMTGYASMETAIQAIKEGAYDYITKPFQVEEMYIAVKNACEKLFLRREHRSVMDELRRLHEDRAKGAQKGKGGNGAETVGDIERLAGLRDRGALTKEEFDVLKHRYFKEGH